MLVRLLGRLGLLGSMLIRRVGLAPGICRDMEALRLGPLEEDSIVSFVYHITHSLEVRVHQRHLPTLLRYLQHPPKDYR